MYPRDPWSEFRNSPTISPMTYALELRDVTKRYVGHLAVDRLSLAVPQACIYGILGPNGAGKSTTLRMVMNIIARDSGAIGVLGADPVADRAVLRRVGYLPEERGLYKKMTVIDAIVFFAALRGMPESRARQQGVGWLEKMGLGQWQKAKIETLSKGMQQKVQFITTVIHDPELLILDEPASGLDPVNQEVLRDTILGAREKGRTVVFSTHNMDQAEQLCDSVCIIAQGRKVLDGPLARDPPPALRGTDTGVGVRVHHARRARADGRRHEPAGRGRSDRRHLDARPAGRQRRAARARGPGVRGCPGRAVRARQAVAAPDLRRTRRPCRNRRAAAGGDTCVTFCSSSSASSASASPRGRSSSARCCFRC